MGTSYRRGEGEQNTEEYKERERFRGFSLVVIGVALDRLNWACRNGIRARLSASVASRSSKAILVVHYAAQVDYKVAIRKRAFVGVGRRGSCTSNLIKLMQ